MNTSGYMQVIDPDSLADYSNAKTQVTTTSNSKYYTVHPASEIAGSIPYTLVGPEDGPQVTGTDGTNLPHVQTTRKKWDHAQDWQKIKHRKR